MLIISNNPKVKALLKDQNFQWVEGNYKDVLVETRKLVVDQKMSLLSHPISGSIKPNETVYRSIILDDAPQEAIDMESLDYMDRALELFERFNRDRPTPDWPEKILEDFATVDFHILEDTYNRIKTSGSIHR